MTEAEWLAALANLRTGGGRSDTYLVRCRPVRHLDGWLPPAVVPYRWWRSRQQAGADGVTSLERYDVALYPASAASGSNPMVLVPIGAGEPVDLLDQTQPVTVRGDVEAGGAVVIEAGGHRFDAIGPCDVPMFWRRRYRL